MVNGKNLIFSLYDVIFHVAGIAHQDAKADQEELYYKVNRDPTIEVAQKQSLKELNNSSS